MRSNKQDDDDGIGTNEYEVETIRNRKVVDGVLYYLLKWRGYGEKENSWEPLTNLNCPELISEYEKLKGNTNKRWRHHSIRIDKNNINSQNLEKDQIVIDTNITSNANTNNNKNTNSNKSSNSNNNRVNSNNNNSSSTISTNRNADSNSGINNNSITHSKSHKQIKKEKKNISKTVIELSEDVFEDEKKYDKSSKSLKETNLKKKKKKKKHQRHDKEKNDDMIVPSFSSNFDIINITNTKIKPYTDNDIKRIPIYDDDSFEIEIEEIDDDIDSNFYSSKERRHKRKRRKLKEEMDLNIIEKYSSKDIIAQSIGIKDEREVIDINDTPYYPLDSEYYQKIYYKKLYKRNNTITNDTNVVEQVQKNVMDWVNVLSGSHFDKINVYNDIDLDGPPPNFKYISTCEYGKDVPKPEDITDFIIGCDCVGGCENEILCSCSVRDNYDVPISFSYNKKGEVLITRSNIIHECNIKCFCGPDCPNRVIQKNNIPKLEIFKTKNKGWGVRTKELIRKSTFVAEYTGEIIKTDRVSERIKKDPERTHYIFDIDILGEPEYSIDAYKMGNISHFFNHSCDPNLEVYCAQCDYYEMNIFRIAFFAKRDIEIDEELTFDYIGMEKPCGILKNVDHYSINTSSSISSASSIPISPGVLEDEVYIRSTITPAKREKTRASSNSKIVININSEDESSNEPDSNEDRKLLKYRYNTRSQSKIQTRSKTKAKAKSQPSKPTKSKAEIEEEKNLFVVCHCGSANCRGYVYKN